LKLDYSELSVIVWLGLLFYVESSVLFNVNENLNEKISHQVVPKIASALQVFNYTDS